MPRIVRAEFLSYYNSSRNSDKVFNVFVIEDDDRTYACVSEYGRRGNNLVRDMLCTRTTREIAESKLRQKLGAKRNHRETPYTDESFGYNYSPLARQYGFNGAQNDANANLRNQSPAAQNTMQPNANVIAFPAQKVETPQQKPKPSGIINQEQFDSLEI